jgi:hypothetical protein
MKVDLTKSKKDKKELLFDGGDGDEVDEDKQKSRANQKKVRYANDCEKFK